MRPHPPTWALDAGLPEPLPDENFDDYWRRMGVPDDVIACAFEGLTWNTTAVAHERMAAYVRSMTSGRYSSSHAGDPCS